MGQLWGRSPSISFPPTQLSAEASHAGGSKRQKIGTEALVSLTMLVLWRALARSIMDGASVVGDNVLSPASSLNSSLLDRRHRG
jgi:hypothetical protein